MSFPNPKGYVVPPQDMPPKGGYFFPKYRLSTLTPKGLTSYQIAFSFFGLWAYGLYSLVEHSEWRNGRVLGFVSQFFAQRTVSHVLYGPATRLHESVDPTTVKMFGLELLPWLKGRDPRSEAFITSIMTDDKRQQVDRWRQATRDAAVAPYQVCYGPENYPNTKHVCNKYCIHPNEIKNVRELETLKADKAKL